MPLEKLNTLKRILQCHRWAKKIGDLAWLNPLKLTIQALQKDDMISQNFEAAFKAFSPWFNTLNQQRHSSSC